MTSSFFVLIFVAKLPTPSKLSIVNFQVSFIGEDWEHQQLNQRRANSYGAERRELTPNSMPPGPQGSQGEVPPTAGGQKRQSSCDPTSPSGMNGNGPPRDPNRLRPPPPGGGGAQGRTPSVDSTNRPPGGPPPRSRASRASINPNDMALQAQSSQSLAVRDCFIIPQQSVERFLPDGIAVRMNEPHYPV